MSCYGKDTAKMGGLPQSGTAFHHITQTYITSHKQVKRKYPRNLVCMPRCHVGMGGMTKMVGLLQSGTFSSALPGGG